MHRCEGKAKDLSGLSETSCPARGPTRSRTTITGRVRTHCPEPTLPARGSAFNVLRRQGAKRGEGWLSLVSSVCHAKESHDAGQARAGLPSHPFPSESDLRHGFEFCIHTQWSGLSPRSLLTRTTLKSLHSSWNQSPHLPSWLQVLPCPEARPGSVAVARVQLSARAAVVMV